MTSPKLDSSKIVRSGGREAISLYVHIPFCQTKCPYCDFNTYQGIEPLMSPYVDALALEMRLWGRTLDHPQVSTVFFGGGTPSYLPPEQMGRLLESIGEAFEVSPDAEITMEANPGDLDARALSRLRGMGVNRLSIGVQSLDDGLLKMLGRCHKSREAVEGYALARSAGFESLNLDLMYGLPCQTADQWRTTLEGVLEVAPPHISMYCLTLEEGTPLHQWVREGKLPEPDPDLAADMYVLARESLAQAEYNHYEISNWAMPGEQCRHNMAYWLSWPYLGVGPGAHSHLQRHRFWEVASPRVYIQRVRDWDSRGAERTSILDKNSLPGLGPVDGVEAIGPEMEMAEAMFLSLRLLDGMSTSGFRDRFGRDPLELYGDEIRELEGEGLLERSGDVLRLTPRGCLLANQVFMRFL